MKGKLSAALLVVLLLANALPRAASARDGLPEVGHDPPPGDQLIDVRVGFYLLNLVSLDEVHQTFTCTGYLSEKWQDPRLAFDPAPGGPTRRYLRREDIWFPLLQFDNAAEPRTEAAYLLSVAGDGAAEYVQKFAVELSTNLALRAFPFDSQDLRIYVHPFANGDSRIRISVDPTTTGVSRAPYTPLPLWRTGPMSYRLDRGEIENGTLVPTHAVFAIHVQRVSEYYIYTIFLPLFLMVAISWGALWIPPGDLNSQLVISVTTVLTLVAFSVGTTNVLPPVPYLTFCNMFFLICFVFVFISVGEILIVHTWHNRRDAARARQIRETTRRVLPPAFLLTTGVFAYLFLR
ncbi:MAG TPA: hypothetical protein VFB15_11185 [Candidatus Binataceae bacterium]|nr:hypothetical protein [Candidatus Binataceae bacterium]